MRLVLMMAFLACSGPFSSGTGPLAGEIPMAFPCPPGGVTMEGCLKWTVPGTQVGMGAHISPDGQRVFVVYGEFLVQALETSSGRAIWTRHLDGAWLNEHMSTLSSDGGLLFVGGALESAQTGIIYALDTMTGTTSWEARLPAFRLGAVTASSQALYIAGASGHAASGMALNPWTGTTIWNFTFPSHDSAFLTVAAGNGNTVFAGRNGTHALVVAAHARDGVPIWRDEFDAHAPVTVVAVAAEVRDDRDAVLVLTSTYAARQVGEVVAPLLAYRASDGVRLWLAEAPSSLAPYFGYQHAMVMDQSHIIVGGQACDELGQSQTCDYGIYAVDWNGQQLWETRHDVRPLSRDAVIAMQFSLDGKRVYVAGFSTIGSTLYQSARPAEDLVALNADSGRVEWSSTVGSYVFALAVSKNVLIATGWSQIGPIDTLTDVAQGSTFATTAISTATSLPP